MLYIKTAKYISAIFRYKSEIPKDFAMSVYRAMHNQADYNDWETLDKYSKTALSWIRNILEENNVENIEKEMSWWRSQLAYPYN